MRVALDTNRLTDLFRGDADLSQFLEEAEEIWIPLIVLGEIRAGIYGGSRQAQGEATLARFLAKPSVNILAPDNQTTVHYARLFTQLKRGGTPIPDNDLWIAAMVLQHGLTLVTRDHHFAYIPQLLRV